MLKLAFFFIVFIFGYMSIFKISIFSSTRNLYRIWSTNFKYDYDYMPLKLDDRKITGLMIVLQFGKFVSSTYPKEPYCFELESIQIRKIRGQQFTKYGIISFVEKDYYVHPNSNIIIWKPKVWYDRFNYCTLCCRLYNKNL